MRRAERNARPYAVEDAEERKKLLKFGSSQLVSARPFSVNYPEAAFACAFVWLFVLVFRGRKSSPAPPTLSLITRRASNEHRRSRPRELPAAPAVHPGKRRLRGRRLRWVPGRTRCPEAPTFNMPRLVETDAGGSQRGLSQRNEGASAQGRVRGPVGVRTAVSARAGLRGEAGAGSTRTLARFPGGLGGACGPHPGSTQIHLCRGISLNIQ